MDRAAVLALYDRRLRRGVQFDEPGFRIERTRGIVRLIGPAPGAEDNVILYSRLSAASADAAIRRQVAAFGRLGRAFEWKLHGHDEPPDLAARLLAHGFRPQPPETLMARDLSGAVPPPDVPAGYEICTLDDPDRLEDLMTVEERVWGEPHAELAAALGAEMRRRPEGLFPYAAYRHGRAVATGWLRVHAGREFASLWGGATLPGHRGRGLYRALVTVRAARACAAGARFLLVDARDSSRPILDRLGFCTLTALSAFVWSPDKA